MVTRFGAKQSTPAMVAQHDDLQCNTRLCKTIFCIGVVRKAQRVVTSGLKKSDLFYYLGMCITLK